MRWFTRIILGLLFVYSISGCVDPISFDTESESGHLVIYGNFSQLNQEHMVAISMTSGFGTPPTPVQGACVEISDDTGNFANYQETESGNYFLPADVFSGIPGKSYQLEVILKDGRTFFSEPERMPDPIMIEDIYFQIGPREVLSGSGNLLQQTLIDVFLDTSLPGSSGNTHLRWTVEEVYSFVDRACGPLDSAEQCYFIDPVDDTEILLFENQSSTLGTLEKFPVRTRRLVPYDEFTARHYFNIKQHTITQREFDYWEKINSVANQSGSLFDSQPAVVEGNLYQEGNPETLVLGYFGVNGQSILRTFITPFDIRPNPVFTCNDQIFFQNHQPECCFCWQKEGTRIERPDYWDE